MLIGVAIVLGFSSAICSLFLVFSESPFSSGVVVGEWFLGNVVYTVSCYMGSCVVFMSLTKGEHSQQYYTVPPPSQTT